VGLLAARYHGQGSGHTSGPGCNEKMPPWKIGFTKHGRFPPLFLLWLRTAARLWRSTGAPNRPADTVGDPFCSKPAERSRPSYTGRSVSGLAPRTAASKRDPLPSI